MSDLTVLEKQKLENVLGMASGYVLDFSDRSFAEFVLKSTGLNIDDATYRVNGDSKAKRLRTFWQNEPNHIVGKLLNALLDYSEDDGAKVEVCRLIVGRLCGGSVAARDRPRTNSTSSPTPTIDQCDYNQLSGALKELMRLAPQSRGFAFEKFLDDMFVEFKLSPRRSFRLIGEQVDGSFHHAHDTYLVEAKWQDPQIGNRELQAFAGTVRSKSAWARGLYVSYSGFTQDGLSAFERGDATRIICMDGLELWQILEHKLDLVEVLSLKVRRAAETGRAYVPVRDLFLRA